MRTSVEEELAKGADVSIIALVDSLIERAWKYRASDIHIVPTPAGIRIRLRIDGVLSEPHVFPKEIHSEVVSRIKVITGLRTDEHHITQDGRFRLMFPDSDEYVDVRVSIAPTYHGENVVMRLLSDTAEHYTLEKLGFRHDDCEKIAKALRKQSGMILATGPTGSGKTTTLYTIIKMLNTADVSLITLEDPIEYAIEGIEQIQVNQNTKLTFANGLRSILRQDPDIIMVGEIRDAETASLAVNTALTGHLLLSTLHTNTAATTLPRLLEMKIEPYLVASTVNIAIGQRLVRKICAACKEEVPISNALHAALSELSIADEVFPEKIFRGRGCVACAETGYRGRMSVNEVLVADAEVRDALLTKASASDIERIAIKNGMHTMREDGFAKARAGDTTIEEVLRVVHE